MCMEASPPTAAPPPDGRRTPRDSLLGGGVRGNRVLTATFGIVLLVLLAVQVLSALWFALNSYNLPTPGGPFFEVVRPVHFFVGFLLFPLIGLKLASVGYRFARYYTRNPAYRDAGAPNPVLRLIAPLLVLSAVVLFASGVEMWSFRNDFGVTWIAVHDIAAFTFVALLLVHVVLHYRQAQRDVVAEVRAPAAGAITRRTLLAGGAVAGLTLAVGAAQWPSSALSFLAPRRAGSGALDFPVMDYEGGAQRVDAALWMLSVSGEVDRPLQLGIDEVMRLPVEEHRYSINCVTGWTAMRTWRGVPVARLLDMAEIRGTATHVQVRSTSGYHWDHAIDAMRGSGALLVTHVDGVRLNDEHGFPLRLMLPGVSGQSNIKWVDGLIVHSGAAENYVAAHTTFGNQPVSGYFLPRNPAGMRK